MPWAKLDDRAWRHARFDGVSISAFGLHFAAVSYSNEKLLDGHLTRSHVEQLTGFRRAPVELVDELTRAGLWVPEADGFVIHDYHAYSKSKAQILAEREDNRERQEKYRQGLESTGPPAANLITNEGRNAASNGVSNAVTNAPIPVPGTRYPVTAKTDSSADESAPNGAATVAPKGIFERYAARLRAPKANSPAICGEALTETFGTDYPPEIGRLGKMAKEIGGPGELVKLMLAGGPSWSGIDNPHDFLQGMIRKRKERESQPGRNGPVVRSGTSQNVVKAPKFTTQQDAAYAAYLLKIEEDNRKLAEQEAKP